MTNDKILKTKVSGGYDYVSAIPYYVLIERVKNFPFYKDIEHYNERDQGSIIRWLYRGLTLEQALYKIDTENTTKKLYRGRYYYRQANNKVK